MEQKRPGRPSKGERDHFHVRLPKDLAAAARAEAARRGLTFVDLVGELVADAVDMPYTSSRTQEALPLDKSA